LLPLGVFYEAGRLRVPEQAVLPPRDSGPWARRNTDGWEIVRRDLPKVTKTYSFDAPNFGDWGKGSHEIDWTRNVYQRDVVAPRNAGIRVVHEGSVSAEDVEVLRFELDDILSPLDADFTRQVLMGINILQESAGCAGVFDAEATPDDVLRHRFVDWVIFPPGASDAEYEREFRKVPRMTTESRRLVFERRDFLRSLGPREMVFGRAFGSNTYFGALFKDDLVVFENVQTGNAVYVMFEDWAALSRLSRTELLRNPGSYIRIRHAGDWRSRLRVTVLRRL
jgi:hypothetical protein